ncbi:MAG: hypothetical protein GY875_01380 [Gammaproteobacteria bacterium]|nr:hypothetical protein [Gammaproteobacteria bacterium]
MLKSARMRILFLLMTTLLLAACDTKEPIYTIKRPSFQLDDEKYADAINREASSPGDLIRKGASDTYELEYFIAMEHKAIAQSKSGAWGWSENRATPDSAIDRALELCRKTNHQPEKPCKIVNIDGFWAADFYRERKFDLS